jgi:subtilisin family serine protease
MKKFVYVIVVLFLLSLFQVPALTRAQSGTPEKSYTQGELLVKFKDGPYSLDSQRGHTQTGATVLQNFDPIGWQLVKLPKGVSVDEGIAAYQKITGCLLAQPNFIYKIFNTPNDPQFGSLYGMTKISAPAAWDVTTGNTGVIVADIDTGIDYNHQDLAANMWSNPGEIQNNGIDDDSNGFVDDYFGYDFINNDSNPTDDHGHGTDTTGTIGAVGNNSVGVVGVNWNVKLMALKTHAGDGNSTAAAVIAAFNYVTMMKNRGINIRVTSSSWGGAPEAAGYDQALKDAIDAAGNVGVLNVFAAGNDGRNIDPAPSYPASYNSPSILSVASSTSTDARSSFSNWGLVSVDVAAPGSSILSTFPGNSYGTISGTSMATPHVAGAAALLVGLNANLSPASLKATLINTVDAVPAFNGLVVSGGRINVSRALTQQTVCNFSLSQPSLSIPRAGGNGSVNVTAQGGCSWGAFTSANWITVPLTAAGNGNGTVNFTVAPNTTGASRTGTINIGGQTFTVTQGGKVTPFSFDGDSKTDLSVWTPSSTLWQIRNSSNGTTTSIAFGASTDELVPGDYDGDGKADMATWRPSIGIWSIRNSSTGTTTTTGWGASGDVPVPGDYDGDGKTDIAVWRPGTGIWFIVNSFNGSIRTEGWGILGDVPVPGDFDGDGRNDIAIWRPSTGVWFIINSSNSAVVTQGWGINTDKPVVGDYDGDGKTDVAVWRPSNGTWYIQNSSNGTITTVGWGINTDVPVAGDYDGDGRTDVAVWRPSNATWLIVNSSGTPPTTVVVFGANGDVPVPSAFLP